jgi:hypothetical protein
MLSPRGLRVNADTRRPPIGWLQDAGLSGAFQEKARVP